MEHRSSICYEGREGGSVKGAPNPQYKGSTHKNISRQMQSDPFLLESWKKMPKIIQKMSKNARKKQFITLALPQIQELAFGATPPLILLPWRGV